MNRGDHFDPFARVLHWGMAVLILAMLFAGVGMVASLSLRPVLIDLHRPLGIALSNDPILAARAAAYSVSFNRRERETARGDIAAPLHANDTGATR